MFPAKHSINTAYVRDLTLSHNLPAEIISPQVVLTADSNDPKSVFLQFHCPSHNSLVENLSCLQIGQGFMVSLKEKLYSVQVLAKFLNSPDYTQTLFLNYGVVPR